MTHEEVELIKTITNKQILNAEVNSLLRRNRILNVYIDSLHTEKVSNDETIKQLYKKIQEHAEIIDQMTFEALRP